MKFTLRGFVCPLLAAGLGVVLAAGPAAPLAVLPSFGAPAMAESGYTLMGLSSPGFFRGAGDGIQGMVTAFGIAAYAECAAAAVFIVLSVAGLFSPRLSRAAFGPGTAALVLLFVYAAQGVAYAAVWNGENMLASASTLAYVPLLVGAGLYAALCVCRAKTSPHRAAGENAEKSPAAAGGEHGPCGAFTEEERVGLVERYGKLFRDGALTEEEFAAAKRRLLKQEVRT